ncbi:hypothetical protein [Falsiroseomonas sp. HW251]|uniref:hypothetical protein n=1 Tax=Falsiroseomonas sp. HW251 TaxID=3390998 RepID=UPI003D30EF7F
MFGPIRVLLAALALPVALAAAPANEQQLRVTTDSAAYCQELAVRVAAQPGLDTDPALRSLAEEGQRLCGNGNVRTGIAKLRRALRAAQPGS